MVLNHICKLKISIVLCAQTEVKGGDVFGVDGSLFCLHALCGGGNGGSVLHGAVSGWSCVLQYPAKETRIELLHTIVTSVGQRYAICRRIVY